MEWFPSTWLNQSRDYHRISFDSNTSTSIIIKCCCFVMAMVARRISSSSHNREGMLSFLDRFYGKRLYTHTSGPRRRLLMMLMTPVAVGVYYFSSSSPSHSFPTLSNIYIFFLLLFLCLQQVLWKVRV